eukprot:CAMPEP_0185168306 /NCGR_PEP_ID=MMETSP1139-20130426/15633_1 /TAXON_ID=298111 /ORGANISM="Pavlova sp., Strain CCMP459" /LENGTH=211 /DNA_ID=CAMNT_0027733813 /DNA_START=66 /DNA_END=702 /DNA_ORIENTATION=+
MASIPPVYIHGGEIVRTHAPERHSKGPPPPCSPLEALACFLGIEDVAMAVPAVPALGLDAHVVPAVQLLLMGLLIHIFPSIALAATLFAFHVLHEKNEQAISRMPTVHDPTEPLKTENGGRVLAGFETRPVRDRPIRCGPRELNMQCALELRADTAAHPETRALPPTWARDAPLQSRIRSQDQRALAQRPWRLQRATVRGHGAAPLTDSEG